MTKRLPDLAESGEGGSTRPFALRLVEAIAPAAVFAAATAGLIIAVDPSLLESRTDDGLSLAAVTGLALAAGVFAHRMVASTVNLGIVAMAQRERRSMWEAIDELEHDLAERDSVGELRRND